MIEDLRGVRTHARVANRIVLRETTESTMDDAREALSAGAESGVLVVADTQSRGRGTHGRTWSSPAGSDLYLSIGLRPTLPLERLALLSLTAGIAIADVVDQELGAATARVKWPNDVLVNGLKIAGVLVESRTLGDRCEAVVGIGFNVGRTTFPEETPATSLALAGISCTRAEVLEHLLRAFDRRLSELEADSSATVRALSARLAYLDELARLDDVVGFVRGVADDGALLFEVEGGVRRVVAGRLLALQRKQARTPPTETA